MSFVLVFDSRSDGGPTAVGPFPTTKGAEMHLSDLMRPGFACQSEIRQISSVHDSIKAKNASK